MLGLIWAWALPRVRRLWLGLLAIILMQGLIGYVQYFTHLPTGMVLAHMVGTTLFAAALGHLFFLTKGRDASV